jgi:chaperonin GroES
MERMFEKFKPLADRVLVKRIQSDEKTESGLIIPEAAKEKAQTGVVMAVGPGKDRPLAVKIGDKVYFGKYSGTEASRDFLIMKEDEILGVVEQ